MLAGGVNVAAQAKETLGTRLGAEATGYLLADLEHTKDLVRVVIGEGHVEVVEEGEHRHLVPVHAV